MLVSDFLTHAILAPSEMLDRNPAQYRFAPHLHADGILAGVRRSITRTNAADRANTAISTPHEWTGKPLCLLQGHGTSSMRYTSMIGCSSDREARPQTRCRHGDCAADSCPQLPVSAME